MPRGRSCARTTSHDGAQTPDRRLIYEVVVSRPVDREDFEHLLARHSTSVHLDRLRRIVREFAEVLELPERVAEVEASVRRALGS